MGFCCTLHNYSGGEVEDLSTQSEILPIKKKGIPVSEKEFYFFKIVVQQGN